MDKHPCSEKEYHVCECWLKEHEQLQKFVDTLKKEMKRLNGLPILTTPERHVLKVLERLGK